MLKNIMMVTSVLCSVLGSVNAFAQYGGSLGQQAAQLAQEISTNERYLAPEQKAAISREFSTIRATLYGAQAPRSEYTCVSRDNDGHNPYVLAIRSGVNVSRLKDAAFANIDSCQAAIQGSRSSPASTLLCVSKDNDGQAPWLVGSIYGNGAVSKLRQSATRSQNDCQALLNRFQTRFAQTTFCGSRDGDGMAPFVAVSFDFASSQATVGGESFQDINQCWSFVNQR